MPCHADLEGSRANRFSVSWAKGKRVFQRLAGKEKCVVERVAMRWFFAVRMERSAGVSAVGKRGNVLEGNVVQSEEGRELSR
jgi:hypothetical protein